MTDQQKFQNNEPVWDVLIIGAGISGLSAATQLVQLNSNLKICVVDKGRGVGGRMATRRSSTNDDHNANDFVWDHGAQFLRFRSEEGQQLGQKWLEQNHLFNWLNELPQWKSRKILQHPDLTARYAGLNGMTTIPKYLAHLFLENEHVDLRCHYKVAELKQIELNSKQLWQLRPEVGSELLGRTVLLTAPVPQSIALFETISDLSSDAYEPLRQIQYEPCLALLIGVSEQPLQSDTAQPILEHRFKDSIQNALQFLDHPILGWIGNNQQKGISNKRAYTIQANGKWSFDHFEDDETTIIETLLEAVGPLIDFCPDQVLVKKLMKWRYSIPSKTYPAPFFQVPGELPLYLAGDAFETHVGAKRIEGSMLSGFAVAKRIAADLKN